MKERYGVAESLHPIAQPWGWAILAALVLGESVLACGLI